MNKLNNSCTKQTDAFSYNSNKTDIERTRMHYKTYKTIFLIKI